MNWKWTLAIGIVFLIGGVLAFVNPLLASLTVEAVVAAAFLLGGAVQLWLAFRNEDGTTGDRISGGALGVVMILFAVSLVVAPLAGLLSLTIMVALFFLMIGGVRIWVSIRMRHRRRWRWIAASGVVSVVLAAVILFGLPGSAFGILGIIFGVELIMGGAAAIALALEAREAGE